MWAMLEGAKVIGARKRIVDDPEITVEVIGAAIELAKQSGVSAAFLGSRVVQFIDNGDAKRKAERDRKNRHVVPPPINSPAEGYAAGEIHGTLLRLLGARVPESELAKHLCIRFAHDSVEPAFKSRVLIYCRTEHIADKVRGSEIPGIVERLAAELKITGKVEVHP